MLTGRVAKVSKSIGEERRKEKNESEAFEKTHSSFLSVRAILYLTREVLVQKI